MSSFPISSTVEIVGTGIAPGQVNFSDGTNSVEVKAPTTLTGTVNFTLPDADGTANQVLTWPTSGSTTVWADKGGSGGGNTDIWFIKDEKTSGTDGGTFSSGAWQTRVLNTINKPSGTGTQVQLAVAPAGANQLRIEDGLYRIVSRAPAFAVFSHTSRLQNVTDAVTEIVGSVSTSQVVILGDVSVSISVIDDVFVVSGGPKIYEIQHRCDTTNTGDGFGVAAGFGVSEVYTQVTIERLAN